MKNMILCCLAALTLQGAYAQKLPNKQEGSFKAPANVKIDGKIGEWGDFKAYNTATDLFYTLANDDQNLYLILKAESAVARDKMYSGGVSLFFSNVGNTDKNARCVVTAFAIPKNNMMAIRELMKDTITTDFKAINAAMVAALKTISVKNLNGVKEDVISVYNEYGISIANYLSDRKTYTCEIAIPLKYLKSFINEKGVINYTLQANAASLNNMKVVMNGKEVENAAENARITEMMNRIMQSEKSYRLRETMNDTNVSGEYTLAK
nr:hypothetical protein [uncultured Mucilaginibacter sp.]